VLLLSWCAVIVIWAVTQRREEQANVKFSVHCQDAERGGTGGC